MRTTAQSSLTGRHDRRSPLGRWLDQAHLTPDDDFQDDGGTPALRARQRAARWSPTWSAIRFVWLFPLVGTGAAFVGLLFWLCALAFFGPPWVASNWGWIIGAAVLVSWEGIVEKGGGLGAGALDFGGMMNSPNRGAWGAIATYFRSLFVLAYACYSAFFWLIVGIAVWAWQSGAWQHAVTSAGGG